MSQQKIISDMNAELKQARNMKEIFSILEKYYDLENCTPGDVTKAGIIMSLQKGVKMVGAKLKFSSNGKTTEKKPYSFNW